MDFNLNMGGMDCRCEDERPNVTLQRLNLVRFPTLKSLSSRTILANLEIIPPEYFTTILSRNLRLFLLEQFVSLNSKYKKLNTKYESLEDEARYRKVFTSFDLLIGLAEPTEFRVDWLIVLSSRKDYALFEVLGVLANKVPNLQKLEIDRESARAGQSLYRGEPAWMNPYNGIGEPVLALKNLTSLTVMKCLWPEDLIRIGDSLPGLEFLECSYFNCHNLNELMEAAINMMRNLKSLRHLIYEYVTSPSSDNEFGLFCLEHFPQLHTIGGDCNLPLYRFGRQIDIPIGCQLRKLTICISADWFANLDSNPFLMLPNIIELRVFGSRWWSESKLESLSRQLDKLLNFPRLRHLCLREPHPNVLRMFLNCYGRNLVKLELEKYELGNFEVMQQLIDLCPILEELLLEKSPLTGPVEPPLLSARPGTISSLKTLHLQDFTSSVESILLAAPELKNLKFESVQLSQVEGQRLSNLISGKLICTKVTSFEVLCAQSSFQADRRIMCEISKDMIAFCHNLVDVSFKWDDMHYLHNNYPLGHFGSQNWHYRSYNRKSTKGYTDCCLQRILNLMNNYHSV